MKVFSLLSQASLKNTQRALTLALLSLSVILFSGLISASECAQINCDCSSLLKEQRQHCQKQEASLLKQCQLSRTVKGFCSTGGLDAVPVALSVSPELLRRLVNQAFDEEVLRDQLKSLRWSVTEDHNAAIALQNNDNFRGALALRKRENKARKQWQAVEYRLAELLIAEQEVGDARDIFGTLHRAHARAGEQSYQFGRVLWLALLSEDEVSSSTELKLRQILAQRLLRNAGDAMELAGDAAHRSGKEEQAVVYWELSAQYTEELVAWKQSLGSKAQHITFYQQRAAARWRHAGLLAEKVGQATLASNARAQSQRLLQGI